MRESLYAVKRARASEARNSATALFPGQPKRLGAKSYGDDHGNDGRRLGHYPRSNLDRPTVDNAQKMQKSNQPKDASRDDQVRPVHSSRGSTLRVAATARSLPISLRCRSSGGHTAPLRSSARGYLRVASRHTKKRSSAHTRGLFEAFLKVATIKKTPVL